MRVYIKEKGFTYFNPLTKKEDYCNNQVPYILDWDFKLIDDVNQYLLMKSIFFWGNNLNTSKSNAERISDFLDYSWNLGKKWNDINFSDIHNWINYLLSIQQKKSTINAKILAVKGLFDWHFQQGNISSDPFLSFNTKEIAHRFKSFQRNSVKNITSLNHPVLKYSDNYDEDVPTKKELKAFINNLGKEDALMALVLLSTGMRKEELLQLTTDMINSMEELSDGEYYKLYLNSRNMSIKNNKSRSVIINKSLRQKIIKHILNNKKNIEKFKNKNSSTILPVFISNQGNKYSTDKLNKSFKIASEKSGYFKSHGKVIYPHLLRHCFASYYIAEQSGNNSNIENVYLYISERLGHSNIEITKKHYIKVVNKIQQHKELVGFSEKFIEEIFDEK